MEELDELLLMSGQDVPYKTAQLQVHQPRIKDVAVVGEKRFFAGAGLLNFDKDTLAVEDNSVLDTVSNFDIIMMMMQNPNPDTQIIKINLLMVLAVLFPTCTINIEKNRIVLKHMIESEENTVEREINKDNFDELRSIVEQILCLNLGHQEPKFNPKSKMAKRIADKLKKGRQKAAAANGENTSSLLGRYVSILAVGEQKDINKLMNYTLYQLFEEYQRYSAKVSFDMNVQMRLAGAKDVQTPVNWMDDLDKINQSKN